MIPARRTPRPRLHPLAAVIALVLAAVPAGAHAETLPVTSCADDGSPGTLRSVVALAHDGDTIDMTQLACSTITLQQGQINPCDTSDLAIIGPGRDRLTIDGGGKSPILFIGNLYYGYNPACSGGNGTFTLRDVTLAHGLSQPYAWNHYYQRSACLSSLYGSTLLERVTITDCHSYFSNAFDGGAVSAVALTMIDSTIADSSVRFLNDSWPARGGGALARSATLVRSTISGNSVIGSGGGLYVGGNLVMVDSIVADNSSSATTSGYAAPGGGVFVNGSTTILRSTIANNNTDGNGGGLFKADQADGTSAAFTIQNSTIANNRSLGTGGGLLSQWPVTIANSTIAGNYSALGSALKIESHSSYFGSSWVDFESAIIAGNSVGALAVYPADLGSDGALAIFGANNLVGDVAAGVTLPPNTLRGDPQLLPLADNGGRTQTMAPAPGSPVIDAGSNLLGLVADQRGGGFVRVHGAAAEIGAYEVQPPPGPDFVPPTRSTIARSGGLPSSLPVTSCADDGAAGTLRAVAALAHDGDTIDLTALTCSTITLEHGPIDSSVLGPNPVDNLTIVGPGQHALTISGNGTSAVFIGGGLFGGTITLSNLTLAHGAKYDTAACVSSFLSSIVLDGVTATDCHTRWAGGGSAGRGFNGGGGAVGAPVVHLVGSTISDSSLTAIDRNVAAGGGLWAHDATLIGSTISGNSVIAPTAYAYQGYRTGGGGVYTMGSATLIDSTISSNYVEATEPGANAIGGGVATRIHLTVTGSTFNGNVADGVGGGAFASLGIYHPHDPKAPQSVPTPTTVSNSTFTGNRATLGGALAWLSNGTLSNSTFAFNSSASGGAVANVSSSDSQSNNTLYLDSTLIANNAVDGPGGHAADLAAAPNVDLTVIGAGNLVGTADPKVTLPADTLHDDPLLLPLADNGGPTWTMALAPGSPALDAGANPLDLATDQRGDGYVRVSGAAADIGAYEVQPVGDAIFVNGFDP